MSTHLNWKSLEREIARDLKQSGFDAKRVFSDQWDKGSGVDVFATDGENDLLVQCKYGKQPNARKAYKEVKNSSTGKKDKCIAVVRYSGTKETYALISWSDLIELIRRQW